MAEGSHHSHMETVMSVRMVLRHALATIALAVAVIVTPTPSTYDDGSGMSNPTTVTADCAANEYGDTCRA